MRKTVILPLCLIVGICGSAGAAADYTVTSPGDSGAGSLRDIVENQLAGAGAGGDGKSIGFAPGQSIALTGGPITVSNKNLAVTGHAGGLDLPGLIDTIVNQQLAAAAPDANKAQTDVGAIVGQAGAMTSITSTNGGVFTWKLGEGNGQSLADLHVHDVSVTAAGAEWIVGSVAGGGYVKALSPGDPEQGADVAVELGAVRGLVASNITVKSEREVVGGAIGTRGNTTGDKANPSVLTGKVGLISDSIFSGIDVGTTGYGAVIYGGVIGAYSSHPSPSLHVPNNPTMVAEIAGVRNSIFDDISVKTTSNNASVHGGVIGLYADSQDGCPVQTTIGGIEGSLFSNISVITAGHNAIVYGGVVGGMYAPTYHALSPSSKGEIGPITNSVFTEIEVATSGTGANIYGGAISAVSRPWAPNSRPPMAATLGDITGSVFSDIHADAPNGYSFGGAIYSGGLRKELVISGSSFLDNSVSGDIALGGAIFINTNYSSETNHINKLTLAAGAGETTLFSGNTANGRANSIHFGELLGTNSFADAALAIETEAGGAVELRDPLSAYMNNDTYLGMEITGAGDFLWGGVNDLDTDGTTVRFTGGTRTTLLSDFQLNNFGAFNTVPNQDTLTVTFDPGSRVLVDLDARPREDDLAMFANRAGNDKAQFEIIGTADVTPLLLTFNETEARWLVVDGNTAAATAANFNILENQYDAEILTDNGKVYIAISNYVKPPVPPDPPDPPDPLDPQDPDPDPDPTPVARLAANDNPNVIRSYLSGALEDAWQRYKTENPGDVAHLAAIFDELLASPQQQIAEAIVSGANEPFRYMANLSDQAARIDAANCGAVEDGKKWRVWASADYDRDNQFEHDNYEDYDSHRLGQVIGASYDVNPALRLRGYAGFASGRLDSRALASKTKTDSYAGGVSAVWSPAPCTTVELDGAFGYFENDFERSNIVGRHEAEYDQLVWQVGARAAHTFLLPMPGGRLAPFAGARFQRMTQDAVAETGGAWFSNRLDSFDANALYTELGFAWSQDFSLPGGVMLTGSAAPSWRHDFGGREIATDGHFDGSPQRFRVAGAKRALDSFDLDLEIRARILAAENVTVDLDGGYTLSLNDRYGGHNWYAGMLVSF